MKIIEKYSSDCSQLILYLSQPLGKSDGLGRAGGPAGGSGEISATAMVPYSAAQAAMALKKAKKESLAEAVKLAATTAAAAKLASSKTQIKGKCFCKVDVEVWVVADDIAYAKFRKNLLI